MQSVQSRNTFLANLLSTDGKGANRTGATGSKQLSAVSGEENQEVGNDFLSMIEQQLNDSSASDQDSSDELNILDKRSIVNANAQDNQTLISSLGTQIVSDTGNKEAGTSQVDNLPSSLKMLLADFQTASKSNKQDNEINSVDKKVITNFSSFAPDELAVNPEQDEGELSSGNNLQNLLKMQVRNSGKAARNVQVAEAAEHGQMIKQINADDFAAFRNGGSASQLKLMSHGGFKAYKNESSQLEDNIIDFKKGYDARNANATSVNDNTLSSLSGSEFNPEIGVAGIKDQKALNNVQSPIVEEKHKILDLSNINIGKTQELIDKIGEYVVRSSFEANPTVDVAVKHDGLGQFQVSVTRTGIDQGLDIKITANTAQGHQFFKENEAGLMRALNSSGLKMTDLKLVASHDFNLLSGDQNAGKESQGQSFFGQHGRQQAGHAFQDQSERGQSQRRKELWEEYREKLGA